MIPEGYEAFLRDLKTRIRSAQVKAAVSVNREMIVLYWEIGKALVERQEHAGWGKAVVERLARDLRNAFPDIKGFSRSNIYAMRQFFLTYRDADSNVQQLVGQVGKPIGVSEYCLTHTLPGDLAQALPAPGDLERLMQEEGPESNGG